MKNLFILSLIGLCGCGVTRQFVQTTDTNGVVTVLRSTTYTFFDSTATVGKERIAGGKTPSIGLTEQNVQSNGTNIVALLHEFGVILQNLPK